MSEDEVFEAYATAESKSGGKFWEVRVEGAQMHVRYGKLGQDKAWKSKAFDDHAAALKEAKKKLRAKINKGYVESSREGDAGAPPAAAQTYEERWGELRSLVEQKPKKAHVSKIKSAFEAMWAEDRARTEEEVVPYLQDKFTSWPDSYFTHRVKRVGNTKPWPKKVAPLFDDGALDDAPFSLFSRGLVMRFDGRYQPGDDVEVSDYTQRTWVDQPVDSRALTSSTAGQQLARIELVYEDLSEIQQYSTPANSTDFERMVTALPNLRHVTIRNSWGMQGLSRAAGGDAPAKLHTLDLLQSPISAQDFKAITEDEMFSELTSLSLSLTSYGGRYPTDHDGLLALFASENVSHLEELTLSDANFDFDEELARALESSPCAKKLKTFGLRSMQIEPEVLSILLGGALSLKKLELAVHGVGEAHMEALEALPDKISLRRLEYWRYGFGGDELLGRLQAWAEAHKVKLAEASY